ncbi:MAG: uroporphyrinogen-III C-methyltransferase [bacterium]
MKKGKVYIAGAGPGNFELITLRLLNIIKTVNVVVYDHLINKELLKYVDSSTDLIYAGKTAGEHIKSQDEINKILIDMAMSGKNVLRLKGGDPFLFGRGGEEAIALAEYGIDFEIIPGVSSINAVPLYAGIPLTHRGVSSSVAVITGHRHTNMGIDEHNWDAIAKMDTIVVLMGVAQIKQIAKKLVDNGRDINDPVAVIRWGTLPIQTTSVSTLKDILEGRHEPFLTPALIIIGRVVGLREKLNWFEHLPLFGKKVLITRMEKDALFLRQSLEQLGAMVIEQPTIQLVPPDDYTPVDRAIHRLDTYDTIIFTSANAVHRFIDRLWFNGYDTRKFRDAKIVAIGPKTAQAMESFKIRVDNVPDEFKAEGVIALFKDNVNGKKILIPRAQEAREILVEALRRAGAEVDVVPVYKTIKAEVKQDNLPLLKQGVELAIFTSSSTVTNFFDMFGEDAFKILSHADIACIGPITASTVKSMGLDVAIQPSSYTVEDLVEEIIAYYNRAGRLGKGV